jgi:hypothetical protein
MPKDCPLAPTPVSPVNVGLRNPVQFSWTSSPGASLYQLMLFNASNGTFVTQHVSAANELTLPSNVQLTLGDYVWVVAAWNSTCTPATSTPASFRIQ